MFEVCLLAVRRLCERKNWQAERRGRVSCTWYYVRAIVSCNTCHALLPTAHYNSCLSPEIFGLQTAFHPHIHDIVPWFGFQGTRYRRLLRLRWDTGIANVKRADRAMTRQSAGIAGVRADHPALRQVRTRLYVFRSGVVGENQSKPMPGACTSHPGSSTDLTSRAFGSSLHTKVLPINSTVF